jgi:RNA polymerase sigma-70 factor (ECF subfamily)
VEASQYEEIVNACYAPLYRFAFSLSRSAADASDLTQEAFQRLASAKSALRELSKARTWLFTTVYRAFLQRRRHETRFPEIELIDGVVPACTPDFETSLDSASAMAALMNLPDVFRIPVTLFYLDQHSYKEIAEILGAPIGTVMSRISRGKQLLRDQLSDQPSQRSIGAQSRVL